MNELLELVKGLEEEQQKIFYKYLGVVKTCLVGFEEKFVYIKENGFKLDTAKKIIRLLELDLDTIKERLEDYRANGVADMVLNNPELLRFDSKKIIERIKKCDEVGKGYKTDSGEYFDFLFDDVEWKNVLAGLNVAGTFKEIKKEPVIEPDEFLQNILDFNEPIELDAEDFEKYLKVAELVGSAREAILGNNKDSEGAKVPSDVLITKIIRTNGNLTPRDITKMVLKYCNDITEGVDDILDSLIGEKRGL